MTTAMSSIIILLHFCNIRDSFNIGVQTFSLLYDWVKKITVTICGVKIGIIYHTFRNAFPVQC